MKVECSEHELHRRPVADGYHNRKYSGFQECVHGRDRQDKSVCRGGETPEAEPLIEGSGFLILGFDDHAEDADLTCGFSGGVKGMDDERVAIALALPASVDSEPPEEEKRDVFVRPGLDVFGQVIAADGMGADRIIADDGGTVGEDIDARQAAFEILVGVALEVQVERRNAAIE